MTEDRPNRLLEPGEALPLLGQAYRSGAPLDTSVATPETWSDAIHMLLKRGLEANARYMIEVLRSAFPNTYFGPSGELQAADVLAAKPNTDVASARRLLQRAAESGASLEPNRALPSVWASAIQELTVAGDLRTAKSTLPQLHHAFPKIAYFKGMDEVFRRMPADDGSVFLEDSSQPCQIVPFPGADTLVFAFTDMTHQLGAPINIVHRWFRWLGVHVVYLRDFAAEHPFMRGLPHLGATYPETVDAMGDLASNLGASRITCLGVSSGGYPALRYGIDLGAEAAVGYSPTTHADPTMIGEASQHGQSSSAAGLTLDVLKGMDLKSRLAQATSPPRFRIVFSERNMGDSRHANHLRGIPGVSLEMIPALGDHNTLLRSIKTGLFESQLEWLKETSAA